MTEEEILEELRAIRTLLALDKEDKLHSLVDDLDEIHEAILTELSHNEWKESSDFQSELVDGFNVSSKTIQRRTSDLIDQNLVMTRGSGRGMEYRKSSLYRAISIVQL